MSNDDWRSEVLELLQDLANGRVDLEQSPEELLADPEWLEAQRLAGNLVPLIRSAMG